jgi:hypothetical protein
VRAGAKSGDVSFARKMVDGYSDLFPEFGDAEEYELISSLLTAWDSNEETSFAETCDALGPKARNWGRVLNGLVAKLAAKVRRVRTLGALSANRRDASSRTTPTSSRS